MVDIAYKLLSTDESIITLLQLAKKINIVKETSKGGRPYVRFCNELYDRYGKEHIKSIVSTRKAQHAAKKQWKTRPREMPDEVKRKIRKSNIESWKKDDGSRKEKARKSMIENALPISHQSWVREKAINTRRKRDKWANYTDEGYKSLVESSTNRKFTDSSRKKMSVSAIKRGYNLPDDFKHTKETKEKLSNITKKQWEDGLHKPNYQSRGHLQIVDFLKENGYNVEIEYLVSGRPFDIKINDLLIEFNGTYWHLDPREYEPNYFDKSRKVYAEDIWNRDKEKEQIAKQNGYRFLTIWQKDLEDNPTETLNEIIKIYEQ